MMKKVETSIMEDGPISIPKDKLETVMEKISLADSPVGIDAKYTHAVIINYLQQILERLDKLESKT